MSLLSYDPNKEKTVEFKWDTLEDRAVIKTTQRVGPLLDQNKELQNDGTGGWTPSRKFRRVASIPDIVIVEWLNRYGVNIFDPDHWLAIKRLLNDSDWKWLRTANWHF